MDVDDEITRADDQIWVLNHAGRFGKALHNAHDLVARFPDHPRAHFVLRGTFDFQDCEHDALAPYQRAWELGLSGDDVPRFYVQYGSTLRNVGQLEDSVRVLEEGRARFPENAAIQAFLALAHFSARRPADAVATALSTLIQSAGPATLDGFERALGEYFTTLQFPDTAS